MGMMELRKVRGEVNPADLFTKHLTSRERVTKLTELFGCQFREGRASSSPQLRKETVEVNIVGVRKDRRGGQTAKERPEEEGDDDEARFNDYPIHDEHVLPHEYAKADLNEHFPVALAKPDPNPEYSEEALEKLMLDARTAALTFDEQPQGEAERDEPE